MKKAPTTFHGAGAFGEQLSFLPPPQFCPQWPTKGTLADKALGMFLDGQVFDHPDFESRTQSWRLGAVVFTLRTLGWPIETQEVPSPTPSCPDRVIARYRLPPSLAAQALAKSGRVQHAACLQTQPRTRLTPRQERLLAELLASPGGLLREEVDRIGDASNGPEIIAQLRHEWGVDILTQRIERVDRDGRPCKPGLYSLTTKGMSRAEQLCDGANG